MTMIDHHHHTTAVMTNRYEYLLLIPCFIADPPAHLDIGDAIAVSRCKHRIAA